MFHFYILVMILHIFKCSLAILIGLSGGSDSLCELPIHVLAHFPIGSLDFSCKALVT